MITALGTMSIGATLKATSAATAAVDVAVGASLAELTAKLSGYLLAQIPSPSLDINAQIAFAANALSSALAKVKLLPGGVALAGTLEAAIAAQLLAQAAIRTASADIALEIDSALANQASINVQVSSGEKAPAVNFAVILSQITALGASIAALKAQLAMVASINASLAVGGLRVYRFDGDIATAGAELQARMTADGIHGEAHLVFLLPTDDASWGALQATVSVDRSNGTP